MDTEFFIERKRASFDIDASLLKELKIYTTETDQRTYEVVEKAIRKYIEENETEQQETMEQMEKEDVLKVHFAVFGKTITREVIFEDCDYKDEYPLFLTSNEKFRWMMDKYIEGIKVDDVYINVGALIDKLNDEYKKYRIMGGRK
jgi:hypothetical protein